MMVISMNKILKILVPLPAFLSSFGWPVEESSVFEDMWTAPAGGAVVSLDVFKDVGVVASLGFVVASVSNQYLLTQ